MTFEDRLENALGQVAESIDTSTEGDLEEVILRGRRRRSSARLAAASGTAIAIVAVVAVTGMLRSTPISDDEVAALPSGTNPAAETAEAVVRTLDGGIRVDERGYTFYPIDDEPIRLPDGHSQQARGTTRFGPAVSDGAQGFIYSVSDVVEGESDRSGWVMRVSAGEASPEVLAEEPVDGVGQVLGLVRSEGEEYAVYSTVAGRTTLLRRVGISDGAQTTVVEDFVAGDAAGDRIVTLGLADGCSTFSVLDGGGETVPFAGLPTTDCPTIDQVVLAPDGTRLAYIDRTGDAIRLVVVTLATGQSIGSYDLETSKQITSFDGSLVWLTGDVVVDVAMGRETANEDIAGSFVVQLNNQLVLQLPARADSVDGPDDLADDASTQDPRQGADADLLDLYTADGWSIVVSPDPGLATETVDLDAFGVTSRGIGPYVLGEDAQSVANASGHQLMARSNTSCRQLRVAPLRGLTDMDIMLQLDGDRLIQLDFMSERFTLDGVSVGATISDALRAFPDAVATGQDAINLSVDTTEDTTITFSTDGTTVTQISVALSGVTC